MNRMKLMGTMAAVIVAAACATVPAVPGGGGGNPGPGPVVNPPAEQVWDLTVLANPPAVGTLATATVIDGPNKDQARVSDSGQFQFLKLKQSGFTVCLERPGWRKNCKGVTLVSDMTGVTIDLVQEAPPVSAQKARRGILRVNNRVFTDDDGDHVSVGVTFMAAAWAYRHDRPRLVENLQKLSAAGVFDYIRVLGVVGPNRGGWEDRTVDPNWQDYDQVIAGLTDLAYDHGFRVEWSIFGGVDTTPTPESRQALVQRFIAMSKGREHKIQHWEVANEAWQNGFEGSDGRDELRRLGRLLRDNTPNRVALSATEEGQAGALYSGSAADIFTIHLDRSINGTGGTWRPARQSWEVQFIEGIPKAWTSNEPIGPQSSVEADADPVRLAMSAAMVWVSGGAGYVYHTGPGVRFGGAADVARGRVANFWEVENFDQTVAGIKALKKMLPADLPNWRPQNGNKNFPDYPFDHEQMARQTEAGDVLRAFCSLGGDRFICAPIKIERQISFTAKNPMTVEVLNPMTGDVLRTVTLGRGQALVLEPTLPAVILRGKRGPDEPGPVPPNPVPPVPPTPVPPVPGKLTPETGAGWFPSISTAGEFVVGNLDVYVGRPGAWRYVGPGAGGKWLDTDTFVMTSRVGAELPVLVNARTLAQTPVPGAQGCNEINAGGGVWTCWRPVVSEEYHTTSAGEVKTGTGPVGVAPSGNRLAWADNYHGDTHTVFLDDRVGQSKAFANRAAIFRQDMGLSRAAVAGGLMESDEFPNRRAMSVSVSNTGLLWLEATGTYTRKVYGWRGTGDVEDWSVLDWEGPQVFDGPGGPWVASITQDPSMIIRPAGDKTGYLLPGEFFYPHVAFVNGKILVASSSSRGVFQLTEIDPNQTRVSLTAVK